MIGFSFSGDASNAGMMFIATTPADQRRGKGHSTADIVADLSPELMSLMFAPNGGIVAMFEPPAVYGVGVTAAFSSCFRTRETTRSATWTVSPTRSFPM